MISFNCKQFNSVYKGTRPFCEEMSPNGKASSVFDFFIECLVDEKLFEHITFCNDVLEIPPIEVFVKYHKEYFDFEMTPTQKRGLGACFGFLFQNIWSYRHGVPKWVGHKITGIKNASYFIK